MLSPLEEQFQFHSWATLTLIDHCATLPPAALEETIPGTMGTVHDTIAHLIGSDSWYLSLITNNPGVSIQEARSLPLADLRIEFLARRETWQHVLAHLDDYDPTLPPDEDGSPEVPHALNLLLAQALHHGDDHRTHVWSILGAKGYETLEPDVWSYWYNTYLAPSS